MIDRASPLALLEDPFDADAPPPVLLPYQQRWVADRNPLKVGEKSRRVGLTWAEASDDVLDAVAEGGRNTFYISATQDMAIEYIEACAMWARAYNAAASEIEEDILEDEDKAIKTYKITFNSGRRVVALSSRPANLRGKQGRVVIDEAAFAPDLAGLLKAALAMLLWGDVVRILSTHNGVSNPFADLIEEIRSGRRGGTVHRITFADAVRDGLYQRVCLRRGIPWTAEGEAAWVADAYKFYGDDAAEELDVVPSQSGGAYLSMGLIESAMSPFTPIVRGKWKTEFAYLPTHVRESEIRAWCDENLKPLLDALDRDKRHALGEDFARVADLTHLSIGEEAGNLATRVRFVVELTNCPYSCQEQILEYICDRLPRFRGACLDASGNGGSLAEKMAQKYGVTRIEQVKLSEAIYLEEFPKLKAALEDKTLTDIPRDLGTRDDLRAVRVINGVPKLPPAPTQKADEKKVQRHGDAAISLLMLRRAMKREGGVIDYIPVPKTGRARYDADDEEAHLGTYGGAW